MVRHALTRFWNISTIAKDEVGAYLQELEKFLRIAHRIILLKIKKVKIKSRVSTGIKIQR